VVRRMTFNPGVIKGGLKVNQIPHRCVFEVDLRIPVGIERDAVLAEAREICAGHDADLRVIEEHSYPGSMADPDGEMLRIVQKNAEDATGIRPVPMSSLGGSDSRYWRWEGVPAYLYGPSPVSMGRGDEHVTEAEFLAVLRVHLLSAYDYLQASP
jgi:succinyl-diaminopimelate desuccinylase